MPLSARVRALASAIVLCLPLLVAAARAEDAPPIDWDRARELHQRSQRGETLSDDDRAYLQRAMRERQRQRPGGDAAPAPKETTGLVPLPELGAPGYQGESGGLYGDGHDEPPPALSDAATRELARIRPLGRDGAPADDGAIGFVSISMSNATQEFSLFKRLADADARKSPRVAIVDCAQGGQAMAQWAPPDAKPWAEAERRLAAAGVADAQVQVAWIKLANVQPHGALHEHGARLEDDTIHVLDNARARFPNLRIAYLGSRIYGGYATSALNPEPYAYEGAFVVRWLIRDQLAGKAELNWDEAKGAVKAPLLLWGPYLWADGTTPRASDGLVWKRDDFGPDGTHPSESGRRKVADLLLTFVANDPLARGWFTGK